MMKRILHLISVALACFLLFVASPGCIKEYSYEGGQHDSIPLVDTTGADTTSTDTSASATLYSQCSLCNKNPDFTLGKWSFTIDTFIFCGTITGQVMLGARTAFTFFGPSACSTDTGLVMTCYLDNPFPAEAKNINVDRTTLRYYNHVGAKDMFVADISLGFSLSITSYSESTGIMKGYFSGLVYTDRNDIAQIENGKFEIQFP